MSFHAALRQKPIRGDQYHRPTGAASGTITGFTMKLFTKALTGLLMIAITGFPGLAAAMPCLRTTQAVMCCHPGCPMIAKPTVSKATGRVEIKVDKPACCRVFPSSSVRVVFERTADQPMDMAGRESLATTLTPPIPSKETARTLTYRRVPEPTQAVLCTFLI